ncbi:hypothetical protein [Mesorhizobium silamurunense]|uniref:hypothetical protein n=1 Tax=Mesorhizobium silamurunense TaxID=499528 RepID=UPI0017871ACE|nr:hypothetical protein [Mesorhizobium silamurunense]
MAEPNGVRDGLGGKAMALMADRPSVHTLAIQPRLIGDIARVSIPIGKIQGSRQSE